MVKPIELLGNRNALVILEAFLQSPKAQFIQKELMKKTGITKVTLIKWLSFLEKDGFIAKEIKGNLHLYRLQRHNPIVKQLKILKTIAMLQPLNHIAHEQGCEIFLYGSASRGEDDELSDIDLLVIGKAERKVLIPEIERKLPVIAHKIKLQIFAGVEWGMMAKKDPAFYGRVEKDKIELTWT